MTDVYISAVTAADKRRTPLLYRTHNQTIFLLVLYQRHLEHLVTSLVNGQYQDDMVAFPRLHFFQTLSLAFPLSPSVPESRSNSRRTHAHTEIYTDKIWIGRARAAVVSIRFAVFLRSCSLMSSFQSDKWRDITPDLHRRWTSIEKVDTKATTLAKSRKKYWIDEG